MKQKLYGLLLRAVVPGIHETHGQGLSESSEASLLKLLLHHRCRGGILRIFEKGSIQASYYFGKAGKSRLVKEDTNFRVASISKMITAMAVLKLSEQGRIDLDEDTHVLSYRVSLRQLLTHTAAIHDGKTYNKALSLGSDLTDVLKGDSYCPHIAGEKWEYSNLGAGMIAIVLEKKLDQSFESIMQETLFQPLSIKASFYPQLIRGELSDAWRILPPARSPSFDAEKRRQKPLADANSVSIERHYLLAQGNCCINGKDMQVLLNALMVPGYLSEDLLGAMRYPQAVFGKTSAKLKQGMGIFLLDDKNIAPFTLFGHQGKAYGAVHAAFFEPQTEKGMIFFSSGVSQAKTEFLADVVTDLLKFCFGRENA